MIIILGAKNDCHALHMLNTCHEQGEQAVLFDSSQYPASSSISWNPSSSQGSLLLHDQAIRFDEIKSVFWSSISQPLLGNGTHTPINQIAMSDSCSVLRTFLDEDKIHWVNSWKVFDQHKVKPRQLAHAKRLGAQIPDTYIGNNAEDILAFTLRHDRCIFKPVYGGAHATLVGPEMLETTRLNAVLKYAPVTIQSFVSGTNIRTFVIGDEIFSAQILSEKVDFRLEDDPQHIPIQLPDSVCALAKQICRSFGMAWTAIDWRLNEDGEYVFLEANPSPMFIHFERVTGYPLTQSLLKLLTH
ncbi:RimK family alpha-L-glutamate ligase [Aliiglaciecola sp. M165]|uniref:ATP-grasp domain-containing protein n=1 Tax=Aliiglaciecola sp. M165 TaxID=2593649 RepID=UPI00117EED0D|nr:hypothetical protein [Aliiglaciecola sp. M165]TRY29055.1 hypothetical protein FM019_19835 [Aliiglaciecola sp. M165]